jgi:hypothetical protein
LFTKKCFVNQLMCCSYPQPKTVPTVGTTNNENTENAPKYQTSV